ncbi:MAG: hypothetical protein ACXQTD_06800 [Candidatus Syntropharchaeia archaeon]
MIGEGIKIVFKVVDLAILLAVIGLAFSMMSVFMTSINEIVYELPSFEDSADELIWTNASSQMEFNQKILNATKKMEIVKGRSFQTLEELNDINAVILNAGADVLFLIGQDEIAQIVKMQSLKLRLRVKMLDYASHLDETGKIKEGGIEEVKKDFDDLQMLLKFYREMKSQTGEREDLFGQMKELMEPIE